MPQTSPLLERVLASLFSYDRQAAEVIRREIFDETAEVKVLESKAARELDRFDPKLSAYLKRTCVPERQL